MKRAYVAPVLDLSQTLHGGACEAHAVGTGLRALLTLFEREPSLRLEVALAGGVTQALLRAGEERALQLLAERASAGQISFLATACWGAFLPLVPQREAARQLDLNAQVNREALGDSVYRETGLFPPQLGYSRSVAELACERGLPRILADALAWRGGASLPRDRHFALRGQPRFNVFFVDRLLSQRVDSGALEGAAALHREIAPTRTGYAVLRLPARSLAARGLAPAALAHLSPTGPASAASLDELLALFPEVEQVDPVACALGTGPAELAAGIQFARWSAPGNEAQALLWRLAQIAAGETARLEQRGAGGPMRALLDESLDGAAWRYASAPELDPVRVAEGGRRLLAALCAGGDAVRFELREEAEELFARLLSLSERASSSPPWASL